jgi:integrase
LAPILAEAIEESTTGYLIERRDRPVCTIRRSFAAACQRADLHDVTPYTLRHTGSTLLLAAGVPIRQVAGMLGHTEQRTTELYGKHHIDFLSQASSTLDELFPSYAPVTRQLRVTSVETERFQRQEKACKPLSSVVPIR